MTNRHDKVHCKGLTSGADKLLFVIGCVLVDIDYLKNNIKLEDNIHYKKN